MKTSTRRILRPVRRLAKGRVKTIYQEENTAGDTSLENFRTDLSGRFLEDITAFDRTPHLLAFGVETAIPTDQLTRGDGHLTGRVCRTSQIDLAFVALGSADECPCILPHEYDGTTVTALQ